MSSTTPRSNPTQLLASTNNYAISPKLISTSWSKISTGVSHVLGIKSNGKLYAWGYNNQGQLGDSTTVTKSSPVQIGNSTWNDAHAGPNYSIALRNDYIAFGWGYNDNGQLGDTITTGTYRSSPVQVNSTSWNSIATGTNHIIALKSDNTLWGWGTNSFGQLGQEWYSGFSSPVQISSSTYSSIDAGNNYSLAINSNYNLVAFGDNYGGQLGYAVPNTTVYSWTMIADGNENTLAIRSDGLLFGWGTNSFGQLGQTDLVPRSSPTQIGTTTWSKVAVGVSTQVLAITTLGKLFVWGNNIAGELGDGTTINRSSPVQIGTSSWSQVSAGASFSVGITTNGAMFAWGLNTSGQLGNVPIWRLVASASSTWGGIRSDNTLWMWGANGQGEAGLNDNVNRSSPVQVGTATDTYSTLALGVGGHTVAVRTNGTLWAWGYNGQGQLGLNDVVNRSSPVQIGTASNWTAVAAQWAATFAINNAGELYAWGDNGVGTYSILGDNTSISRSSPIQIGVGTIWSKVFGGTSAAAALTSTSVLYVWGVNDYGQLGLGDTINRSSPVQITSVVSTSWSQIAVGQQQMFGITTLTRLYSWGRGQVGYTGLNETIDRSDPVQIGSSSWMMVGSQSGGGAAITIDGKLFIWGANNTGQLGLSLATSDSRSSPTQVGTSSWSLIGTTALGGNNIGTLIDGKSLYSWGRNFSGDLGQNDTVDRSSPVQVPGEATPSLFTNIRRSSPIQINSDSWLQVSAGFNYTMALKTDYTLWTWGNNSDGQLGIGSTSSRSSPVQVGTSSWSLIAANQFTSAAVKLNKKLFTWGDGRASQLGNNTVTSRSSPVQVHSNDWSINANTQVGWSGTLTTGGSLGIQSDGSLWLWGYPRFVSTNTAGGDYSWSQISAGRSHTAAIRSDGRLFVWGLGANGQLGQNDTLNRSSPTQIGANLANEGEFWYSVSVMESRTVAIRCDNTLWVWGINNGYVGLGDSVARSSPTQLTGAPTSSYTQVYAGESYTIASTSAGTAYYWTSTLPASGFLLTVGTGTYNRISAGNSNALVIDSDYKAYSWGDNAYGQLGTSIAPLEWSTVFRDKGGISGGQDAIFALRSDKTLWVWGTNRNGIFANNENATVARSSPVQVPGSWSSVGVGQSFALGIQTNGTLWGWGYNLNGVLWDAYTINTARSSPVQMGSASNWSILSVGSLNAAAIDTSGQLYTWGDNTNGQLGLGDQITRSSPTQVSGSWTLISNSTTPSGFGPFAFGIKSDNSLWSWGDNTYGTLGNNSTGTITSPIQLLGTWRYADAGALNGFAIKDDYTLWGWGSNTNGELGQNAIVPTYRSSPVQVATNNFFRSVTTGLFGNLATKLDGTILGWGADNGRGTLGLGTTIARSSPTQIGTLSWSIVSISLSTTLGITAGGAPGTTGNINNLYGWGIGIGNGTAIARSSPVQINAGTQSYVTTVSAPVQIGTSSWISVAAGTSHSLGVTSLGKMFAWGDNSNQRLGYLVSTTVLTLSSSATTAYIQSSDNSLYTWGYNAAGQIGDGTTVTKSVPTNITLRSGIKFKNIAQARNSVNGYTLAIDSVNSMLWAWGANTTGYIGTNDTLNRSYPVQISRDSWSQIAVGLNHSIAIKSDGTLWGWGSQPQAGYLSWRSISSGTDHTLAIRSDFALFVWGGNNAGQLGDLTIVAKSAPVRLFADRLITSVSAGSSYSTAIDNESRLWAWGINNNGQLALSTTINRSSPVQVGTSSWTQISAGGNHTLGILLGGSVYAWGLGTAGQLGNSAIISRSSPVQVSSSSFSLVSAGGPGGVTTTQFSAGISAFRLFTWGYNINGQLGLGDATNRSSPTAVGTSSWTTVSSGVSHMMGITTAGSLYGWGFNSTGAIGDGTTVDKSNPTIVYAPGNFFPGVVTQSWSQVQAGNSRSVGLLSGRLYTWGSNTSGALGYTGADWRFVGLGAALDNNGKLYTWGDTNGSGQNTTALRSSPVQLGTSSWIAVGSGGGIAIRVDGTLWSWYHFSGGAGSNYGQPGQNDIINRSSPVQVGTDTDWVYVDSTDLTRGAIKRDGRLYMWGRNQYGQLGTGDNTARSSPVQIPGSWTQVFMSSLAVNTFATKADKTLWAWGFNGGTLGLGDTVNRNSPVQVPGSWNMVSSVSGNSNYIWTIGIQSDGSLWGWGDNNTGGIGDNTTISRSSPIQVSSSSWSMVAATNNASAGISAFRLFTWGGWGTAGIYGGLGDGTTNRRSSPVQVGTSSWTFISSSYGGLFGITGVQGFNSTLFSWGYNSTQYFLGNATTGSRSSPVQIQAAIAGLGTGSLYPIPVNAIGNTLANSWSLINTSIGGGDRVIAAANDQLLNLFNWGAGTLGGLGLGDSINRSSPVQLANTIILAGARSSPSQISASTDWSVIAAVDSASFAIKTNGTLWTWGTNTDGRMGLNDTLNRSSIVQIGSGTNWSSLAGGRAFVLARTTGNVVFAWGQNSYGQLGIAPLTYGWKTLATGAILRNDGSLYTWAQGSAGAGQNTADSIIRSVPTQLGTSSWTAVGNQSGIALRVDGTIWAWYQNIYGGFYGQAGQGDTIARSSPVQVGAATNWSSVQSSRYTRFAINNLGQLWGWGYNNIGTLGDGTTISRSSPVQIAGSWSMIYSSDYNAAGIKTDGTLWTWGDSYEGVLGINSLVPRSSPVQVAGTWSTVVMSGGQNNIALAIQTNGTLWAWGSNPQGQLGQNDTIKRSSPVQIPGSWTNIAADNFSCAGIKNDGTLWSWGRDFYGDMGQNTNGAARSSPIQVGNSSWNFIYGSDYTYGFSGRLTNGVIYAWGGQSLDPYVLGDGTSIDRSSPVQISTTLSPLTTFGDTFNRSSPTQVGTGYTSISAGESSSIALDTSGNVWNWGYNLDGNLGNSTIISRSSPVQVTSLPANIETIAAGSLTHFATKGSILYGWGSGTTGQIGDGTIISKSSPVQVTTFWYSIGNTASSPVQIGTGSSWTIVSAGISNSLAISSANTLFSWGNNDTGQLGLNDTANRSSPTQIGTSSFSSISVGGAASFALRSPSNVISGFGAGNAVGSNSIINRSSPVQVFATSQGATAVVPFKLLAVGTSSWSMVAVGKSGGTSGPAALAIASNGLLYSWGTGTIGLLGNNNINTLTSSPVQVGNIPRTFNYSPTVVDSANSYIAVSAGFSHALAIRSNNTLYGWGNIVAAGTAGIPTTASWKKILSDGQYFMARRGDDTLWVWGKNDQGQLGLGDTLNRSLPIQLGTDTYIDFAPGQSFAVVVKSNNTLWTWGRNNAGQLGTSDLIQRSSPVQIGVGTSWSKAGAGLSHGMAVATTGILYTWGGNAYGQLGQSDTLSRSAPTQVGSSSWTVISGGSSGQASAAIDNSGTLYVWGYNVIGIQGNGDTSHRSSPVQFGSTTFRKYSLVTLSADYTLHAIATDGRLWGTGFMAGTNNFTNASSPTLIGSSSTDYWVDIVGSGTFLNTNYSVQAKKADGTMWTWGFNISGKLGISDTLNRSSPVQLSALSYGTPAGNGVSFAAFIDSFGRLSTAGLGTLGELGDSQVLYSRSSPAQILSQYSISTPTQITSGSWSAVSAGSDVSLIASTTGSLYAWGVNSSYQTGIGTGQLFVTSPVVIGSSVSSASVGSTAAGYIK